MENFDYEKAYKAVLQTATQWIKDGCTDKEKICLECVCPELRESEDERIRREIIDFIQWAEDRGMTRRDYHQAKRPAVWIAYLEKRKEPEWSDIDREMLDRIIERGCCELPPHTRALTSDMIQWLQWIKEGRIAPKQKEQKPCDGDCDKCPCYNAGLEIGKDDQKPAEWSDNDDQLIGFIFDLLNDLVWRKDWAMGKEECLERLNSLRPSWKPSEEQMRALGDYIDGEEISSYDIEEIVSLYNNLRNL